MLRRYDLIMGTCGDHAGGRSADRMPVALSPAAERLGRRMAEALTCGVVGTFTAAWLAAHSGLSAAERDAALGELEMTELVTLRPAEASVIADVHTGLALFIAFDPVVTGHRPLEDSVVLARLLIAEPSLRGRGRALARATEWEPRRFNPALALVTRGLGRTRSGTDERASSAASPFPIVEEDVPVLRDYVRALTR